MSARSQNRATPAVKTVKLTVTLSEEVVGVLQQLADEAGTSVTEQLRRAISTQRWLHDVRRNRNARVLVEDPVTGNTREVQFIV
jgi:Ribbon-helix-helix protein, copG family